MNLSRLSIRLRLAALATLLVAVTLTLSGIGLGILFDRQVRQLLVEELEASSNTLLAGIEPGRGPRIEPEVIGRDPRYLSPYSGYYWVIEFDGRMIRSPSLWDAMLPVPPIPVKPGQIATHVVAGPDDQRLLLIDRTVTIGPDRQPLRLMVAASLASHRAATQRFQSDLLPLLLGLGTLLILGSAVQLAIGLRPFARIPAAIAALQTGARPRIGEDLPRELRPLARAIDGLLEDRDQRITRARHAAADLAHTLKTPLQALMGQTEDLRRRGDARSADAIDAIAATVRTRVDRELGRARLGGRGPAEAHKVAEGIIAVLRRTPRGAEVRIRNDLPTALRLAIDPNDLADALGSLMENALRHAQAELRIHAGTRDGYDLLHVDDDGAGVAPEDLNDILIRGLSRDTDGTGLGLALTRDIMQAVDGRLHVENRASGFRATLVLPRIGVLRV